MLEVLYLLLLLVALMIGGAYAARKKLLEHRRGHPALPDQVVDEHSQLQSPQGMRHVLAGARRTERVTDINTRRFWRGCAWGVVGTLAMTVALLLVWRLWPSAVSQPLPLGITVGIVARVFDAQPLNPGVLVLGAIVQFAYGAIWGGLLEVSTRRATVGKGIVLGIGLWLMMVIFYMPMAGIDTFSVATSPGIWLATLIGHLIYGYTVGWLLARDQRKVPPPEEAAVVQ
jgi:hypothetical protein